LIWAFTCGSQREAITYVDAVPSVCGEELSAGNVDFALVPIIEYQRLTGVKLIPHVCVASREKVRSVVLVSRFNNLKKIRSVALDESSRTSAALVKIVFREFLGIEPAWATSIPNLAQMLRDNDAALIIGDPAMTFSRKGLNVWDLASLWHDFTGRGFVFAMWMAAQEQAGKTVPNFAAAADEGIMAIDEIIEVYTARLGLPAKDLRDYLTNNVTFDLDNDLESGMRLYFDLAARHGLIEQARPLEFFDVHAS
jgi:chorismate dehydratase